VRIFPLVFTGCKAAKRKIMTHYCEFTKLPINSILGELIAERVISLDDKKIMETMPLESDRVMYLLDNILLRSLSLGLMQKYTSFVKVLECNGEDEVIKRLVKDLGV